MRDHDRRALGYALQRLYEFHHVGDPALEQIPDAAPAGQQLHFVFHVATRREHDDGRLWGNSSRMTWTASSPSAKLAGGIRISGHHQIGRRLADDGEELAAITALPYHVESPSVPKGLADPRAAEDRPPPAQHAPDSRVCGTWIGAEMRTATVNTGRHIHVVDGQTVAILDVSQPVPKVRRRRRRIAGIAGYRVFDRGADIVGYADQVPYRVGLGGDPQKQATTRSPLRRSKAA